MDSIVTVRPLVRGRLALIAAAIFALLCSFVVTAPAQAGYYEGYNPCSYRCGYPAYRPYPAYRYYPRYRYGCYSCGRHLIYERRYVEREYVERRYGDRGPGAMAMAVSGAVGQRRISMDTNGPVMRNRRGRQGLFRMRATTDLVLLP
jgi:hypothetical protein